MCITEHSEVASERILLPNETGVDAESFKPIEINQLILCLVVNAIFFKKVDHAGIVDIRFLFRNFRSKLDAKLLRHHSLTVGLIIHF